MKRRGDLSTPRRDRRIDLSYHAEVFGQFSESIARFLGTARFLVWQTIVIAIWLVINIAPPAGWQFDPWGRGLVLLTLVLSLQASYAAPLILLAQNRQERRDRVASELDRRVAERTQADTEFLARELASVRLALADVAHQGNVLNQAQLLPAVGLLEILDEDHGFALVGVGVHVRQIVGDDLHLTTDHHLAGEGNVTSVFHLRLGSSRLD